MTAPAFLADAMLGRLARWLRVLGYDTAFDPDLPDAALVRLAAGEGRVLLTRDRHLLRELRPARALEIREDTPLAQLREVIDALGLAPPRELFTRCLVCNTPLETVAASMADAGTLGGALRDTIPPSARELDGPVRRCAGCGRTYWPGSHVRRMRAALEAALPHWGALR